MSWLWQIVLRAVCSTGWWSFLQETDLPELWKTAGSVNVLQSGQAFETSASYYGTKGVLAYDGKHLTFSYTSGFFSKSQRVPINIPASEITSVNVEGGLFKKLIVRTSQTGVI